MDIWGKLFSSKAFFWGLIIAVVGFLAYVFYVTKKANDDAAAAASNVENGGIGTTLGSNAANTVTSFFGGIWDSVKSAWNGGSASPATTTPATTAGAIPTSTTVLTN